MIWQCSNIMNIRFCRQFTLMRNNVLKPRAIKDAIREIDAEICEEQYAKTKLKENWDVYDIKARNVFIKSK